jgi:hypothetical protein
LHGGLEVNDELSEYVKRRRQFEQSTGAGTPRVERRVPLAPAAPPTGAAIVSSPPEPPLRRAEPPLRRGLGINMEGFGSTGPSPAAPPRERGIRGMPRRRFHRTPVDPRRHRSNRNN